MVFQRDDEVIDFVRGRVYANQELVNLGPVEYRIFHYLVKNEGHVVPGQALLEYICGQEFRDKLDFLEASFGKLRDSLHMYPTISSLLTEQSSEGYSFARGDKSRAPVSKSRV
jgi:DNA-binding response OmpR family regulator